MFSRISVFAMLAAVAVALTSSTANAAIQLQIGTTEANARAATAVVLNSLGNGNYVFSDYNYTLGTISGIQASVFIHTNSPGAPGLAEIFSVESTFGGGNLGTSDVYILVSDDSFTQPNGANLVLSNDLRVNYALSGTVAINTLQMASNFVSANQTVMLGAHGVGVASSTPFTDNHSSFELESLISFTYTASPTQGFSTSSTTWLTGPGTGIQDVVVPEPCSMVVWSLLMGSVGLVAARRRAKDVA